MCLLASNLRFALKFLGTFFSYLTSLVSAYFFQILGNSSREYDKAVVQFSVNNQLRHKTNLGESVISSIQGISAINYPPVSSR